MQDLIAQECLEMEVLDRLNSGRFLHRLIFGGGTMLRLCHGLDRFSVDLDFWLAHPEDASKIFKEMTDYLNRFYDLKDAADKYYTLLFELSSPTYPRRLKIEIRKEVQSPLSEQAIAFSPHSFRQVLLRTVSLPAMMSSKIAAFMDRKEIRDVYDMEFLVKKGITPAADPDVLKEVRRRIDLLTKQDYTSKLGSLLAAEKRSYYVEKNFTILKASIDRLEEATAR